MPLPILLDTDLGSDVDDELALALLWGSPEVELLGVSTTYGDVDLRARIVRRMAVLTGRDVLVAPGEPTPLSGRDVWWAGIEGVAYGDLPAEDATTTGAQLLLDRGAGADLLAIAPLTTVAVALGAGLEPAGITVMGGDWADPDAAEHNIASDVVAARRVLGSGLPITVVGVDVTRRVTFADPEIGRFAACGELGAVIAREMRAWMARWDEDVEVPHDPLTALALLQPDLFAFTPPVAVEVADSGAVRIVDGPGTVRIAIDVDAAAARTAMADRIAAGLTPVSS
ncbi:nucleoside hydrolase [Amnibacterium kyonggiense]|uniref:Purine nucleosidase n=1 Tax=Amnibacterium kyonggiense TaxID=595671 RepID=A0A4R7FFK7_9MICO|nr:nucleoside hydrolase [Amnibacterium kyonggiense]TDS76159.1 purine nucleosidase [Amnibacterium kyonggiense]